ncbi:MAG: glycine cleavage system protein GcvH [Phycisphaerales bacterium]|jgi:glycine cleavage system H protein|nr:glycine cleavage system protein GcvH [Phycisphaerales bacterium]
MSSPADRRYSESHEWFLVEGDQVTIGITTHATDALTDITYVEMKSAGATLAAGDSAGEVESVKTTSDVYTAVAGEVAEANTAVVDDPSLVNSDPFGQGWLVRIKTTDTSPLESLMDAAAYDQMNG